MEMNDLLGGKGANLADMASALRLPVPPGFTITTEAWDLLYKPNLDWNHAWGAAPANIVARGLLGIRPTAPGFAAYEVKPRLGGVARATYRYPTPRGAIVVEADGSGARHRLEF